MSTPVKTKSTPMPSRTFVAPEAVAVIAPAPSNIATTPIITRRLTLPTFSSAVSRNAASGGTRPARSAGSIAERTVTTVPTMIVVTIRFGWIVRPFVGISMPNALSNELNPRDSPIPDKNPSADPSKPIINASTIIATTTCRLLAPIARSNAFSLRRCAVVIENTL